MATSSAQARRMFCRNGLITLASWLASTAWSQDAGWLDKAWPSREKLQIENPNPQAIPVHVARVEVPFREGMRRKMQDLRLTVADGVTPLNFWVQESAPEQRAAVWVRLTDVPAGQSSFYLYFGNAEADNKGGDFDAVFTKLPADDDTVALWHLDEGRGTTMKDASGKGLDLKAEGGEVTWAERDGGQWGGQAGIGFQKGSHLIFPGDGQRTSPYLWLPDSPALRLTNFTVEAWVRLDPERAGGSSVVRQGSGQVFLMINPERRPGTWFDGCGMETTLVPDFRKGVPPLTRGQWHHLAVTFDAASRKLCLYQDATLVAEQAVSGPPKVDATELVVGGYFGPTLGGALDEVKISRRALSAEQILADYQRLPRPPVKPVAMRLSNSIEKAPGR